MSEASEAGAGWPCPQCTFINDNANAQRCTMCGFQNASAPPVPDESEIMRAMQEGQRLMQQEAEAEGALAQAREEAMARIMGSAGEVAGAARSAAAAARREAREAIHARLQRSREDRAQLERFSTNAAALGMAGGAGARAMPRRSASGMIERSAREARLHSVAAEAMAARRRMVEAEMGRSSRSGSGSSDPGAAGLFGPGSFLDAFSRGEIGSERPSPFSFGRARRERQSLASRASEKAAGGEQPHEGARAPAWNAQHLSVRHEAMGREQTSAKRVLEEEHARELAQCRARVAVGSKIACSLTPTSAAELGPDASALSVVLDTFRAGVQEGDVVLSSSRPGFPAFLEAVQGAAATCTRNMALYLFDETHGDANSAGANLLRGGRYVEHDLPNAVKKFVASHRTYQEFAVVSVASASSSSSSSVSASSSSSASASSRAAAADGGGALGGAHGAAAAVVTLKRPAKISPLEEWRKKLARGATMICTYFPDAVQPPPLSAAEEGGGGGGDDVTASRDRVDGDLAPPPVPSSSATASTSASASASTAAAAGADGASPAVAGDVRAHWSVNDAPGAVQPSIRDVDISQIVSRVGYACKLSRLITTVGGVKTCTVSWLRPSSSSSGGGGGRSGRGSSRAPSFRERRGSQARSAPLYFGASQINVPLECLFPARSSIVAAQVKYQVATRRKRKMSETMETLAMASSRAGMREADAIRYGRITREFFNEQPFQCELSSIFPKDWVDRSKKRKRARESALSRMPKRGKIVAIDHTQQTYTVLLDPESDLDDGGLYDDDGGGGFVDVMSDDDDDDDDDGDDDDDSDDGATLGVTTSMTTELPAFSSSGREVKVTSSGVDNPLDFVFPPQWLDDIAIAEEDLYAAEEEELAMRSGAAHPRSRTLLVERATLQADALRLLLDRTAADAIKSDHFKVVFTGEQGDDEGGLTRELLGVSLAPIPSNVDKAKAIFEYDMRKVANRSASSPSPPSLRPASAEGGGEDERVNFAACNRWRHASDQLSRAEWERLCKKPLDALDPRAVTDEQGRFIEPGGGFGEIDSTRGFTRAQFVSYYAYAHRALLSRRFAALPPAYRHGAFPGSSASARGRRALSAMAVRGGILDPFVRNCGSLFTLSEAGTLHPEPAISRVIPSPSTRRALYRAAGRLVGAALCKGIPLAHRFSLFFCRRIVEATQSSRLRAIDLPTARNEGLVPWSASCIIAVRGVNAETGEGEDMQDEHPFENFETKDAVIIPQALHAKFFAEHNTVRRRGFGAGLRRGIGEFDASALSFQIRSQPFAPKFVESAELAQNVPLARSTNAAARDGPRSTKVGEAGDYGVDISTASMAATSMQGATSAVLGVDTSVLDISSLRALPSPSMPSASPALYSVGETTTENDPQLAAHAEEAASVQSGGGGGRGGSSHTSSHNGTAVGRAHSRKRFRANRLGGGGGGADHERRGGGVWSGGKRGHGRDQPRRSTREAGPSPTTSEPSTRVLSGSCFPIPISGLDDISPTCGYVGTVVLPRWMLAGLNICSGEIVDLTPQHTPQSAAPNAKTITVQYEVDGVPCVSELPLLPPSIPFTSSPSAGSGDSASKSLRSASASTSAPPRPSFVVSQLERPTVISVGSTLLLDVVSGFDDGMLGQAYQVRWNTQEAAQTLSFAQVTAMTSTKGESVEVARVVPRQEPAVLERARKAAEAAEERRRRARLCPNHSGKHAEGAVPPLAKFVCSKPTYRCDSCDEPQPVGGILYGCRACDFDLCRSCRRAHIAHFGGRKKAPPSPPSEITHIYADGVLDERDDADAFSFAAPATTAAAGLRLGGGGGGRSDAARETSSSSAGTPPAAASSDVLIDAFLHSDVRVSDYLEQSGHRSEDKEAVRREFNALLRPLRADSDDSDEEELVPQRFGQPGVADGGKVALVRQLTSTGLISLLPSARARRRGEGGRGLTVGRIFGARGGGSSSGGGLRGGGVCVGSESSERLDLLKAWLRRKLVEEIDEQTHAFTRGLCEMVSSNEISALTAEQLQERMGGSEITVARWKAATEYQGGLSESGERVKWFWAAVERMNQSQRETLLHFATGFHRIPPTGTVWRFVLTHDSSTVTNPVRIYGEGRRGRARA